jgi:hypothetical protein
MTCHAPSPVAVSRPADPPIDSGLPVMTPGEMRRVIVEYWSIIQPMTIAFVATSGAGMSTCGPMKSAMASM